MTSYRDGDYLARLMLRMLEPSHVLVLTISISTFAGVKFQ